MPPITKATSVAEILKCCPTARRILDQHGLRGCGGEHGRRESLEFLRRSPSGRRGRARRAA
jgi:hypothetical protein